MGSTRSRSWAETPEIQYRIQAAARLEYLERKQEEELLRRAEIGTFRQFIRRVYPQFAFYHHVNVVCDALDRVAAGELKRLMVFMPPRHGKTELISRLFPAYYLRLRPENFVGVASYGASLAGRISKRARFYFTEDGGILDPSSRSVEMWNTLSGGGLWRAGVRSGATGMGYHLGILDDPVKDALEADSPSYRSHSKDWWDSVFDSREEPDAAQVIVQTRWNVDDMSGYLLEKEVDGDEDDETESETDTAEGWYIIDLPAISLEQDPQRYPANCTVEPDWRQPGEALCPERYPIAKLLRRKKKIQPRWWEALYQQRPTIASGTVFIREWFSHYDPHELPSQFIRILCSIDCSFKDARASDFVGITIWGQSNAGMWLLDVDNERLGFVDTLARLKALADRWRFAELIIEDTANGPAVIDSLKREASTFTIRQVGPMGGKEARANAAAPWYERREVFHPRQAPWLTTFENQLLGFPGFANDDLVDSTSQLLNYAAGTGPMKVSTVSYGRGTTAPQIPVIGEPPDKYKKRHDRYGFL